MRRLLAPAVLGLLLLAGCSSSTSTAESSAPAPSSSAASSAPSSSVAPPALSSSVPLPSTSSVVAPASSAQPALSNTSATKRPPSHLLVVLDPGHNGGNASHPAEINRLVPMGFGEFKACNTTGTNTDAGYTEHAFNWDVALRVRKILRAHGIRVVLTRPNDTGVGPCVNKRGELGNKDHAAAVVAIHADGAPSSGHGFHVNTASRRPAGATARTMRLNQDMAVDIHNALARSSGLVPSTYIGTNGYFRRSDLAGLNLSTRPTTFLELGNMRNAHDAALQSSAAGRQRIASAVAAGILAYLAGHP